MRNIFWGIVLVAFGILFLLDNLDVVDFQHAVRTYWPVLLVLWGINILMRKKEYGASSAFSDVSQTAEGELFHRSNVFGDTHINVTSQNFKGGSVSAVFGDCVIDMTNAGVAEGEHWLRVNGVFGNMRIVLPKDAPVAVTAHTVAGSVRIKDQKKSGVSTGMRFSSPDYEPSSRKMKVHATQVFGDITVE